MDEQELRDTLRSHEDWMDHLANRMAELAIAQANTQKQIDETNRALKESGAETDRRLRELGAETDKRIANLVSAIGKLLPRQ